LSFIVAKFSSADKQDRTIFCSNRPRQVFACILPNTLRRSDWFWILADIPQVSLQWRWAHGQFDSGFGLSFFVTAQRKLARYEGDKETELLTDPDDDEISMAHYYSWARGSYCRREAVEVVFFGVAFRCCRMLNSLRLIHILTGISLHVNQHSSESVLLARVIKNDIVN